MTSEKESDPIDVHVGLRMQLRRTLTGMTQEQLAKAIGVSFQQVQKYERGLNRLSASRLFDVCQALGVSISYFFEDVCGDVLRQRHSNGGAVERKTRRPSGDLMAKTETLELVRSYWHIPSSQREKIRALINTLARDSRT